MDNNKEPSGTALAIVILAPFVASSMYLFASGIVSGIFASIGGVASAAVIVPTFNAIEEDLSDGNPIKSLINMVKRGSVKTALTIDKLSEVSGLGIKLFSEKPEHYSQDGISTSTSSFWIIVGGGTALITAGTTIGAAALNTGTLGIVAAGTAGIATGVGLTLSSIVGKKSNIGLKLNDLITRAGIRLDHIRGLEPEVDPGIAAREQNPTTIDAAATVITPTPEPISPTQDLTSPSAKADNILPQKNISQTPEPPTTKL